MTYEVPIVYRGQCNYVVRSDSSEAAVKAAENRFKDGREPDVLGNEWEEIERVGTVEEVEEDAP